MNAACFLGFLLSTALAIFVVPGMPEPERSYSENVTIFINAFILFPLLYWKFRWTEFCLNGSLIYAFAIFVWHAIYAGGMFSSEASILFAMPIYAILMSGLKLGIAMGIATFALYCYLFFFPAATLEMLDADYPDQLMLNIYIGLSVALVMSTAGAVIYQIEITRKTAELERARRDAEQASHAKSAFLANMSHEIRTPMNGVVGMAELLQSAELPERERSLVETIHSSGHALLSILNDILDFSKVEAGQLVIEDQTFNLQRCVEDVCLLLGPSARAKGLDLIVDLPPDLPAAFSGDPGRLRQVLTNLIGNAIKFTGEGYVLVGVTCTHKETGMARLMLEVRDTGIGISEEKQRAVFDSFTQAESSTTRNYGGTGLGLSISRSLVGLMGGELRLQSTPGRGSRFFFDLHLPPVDRDPASQDDQILRGKRMLIVDDLEASRAALARLLRAKGAEITFAASAKPALEAFRAQPFDLILTDQAMPEQTGLELVQDLRAAFPKRIMPVVVLSASDAPNLAKRLAELGVDQVLAKPFRTNDLLRALSSALAPPETPGADRAKTPERAGQVAQAPAHAPHLREARILVADDTHVNREIVRRMLEPQACQLVFAKDGAEALSFADAQRFDLILMDISMPVMDGMQAMQAIRARDTLLGRPATPIVALTAHALQGEREAFLSAGFDDYLAKPVRKAGLLAVVDRLLTAASQAA